jgi:hypothetical protein
MTAVTQLCALLPESVFEAVRRSRDGDGLQRSAILVATALADHPRFTELVQALTDSQGPCSKDPQGVSWTRASSVLVASSDLGRLSCPRPEAAAQLLAAVNACRRGACTDAVQAASEALRHTPGGLSSPASVPALTVRAESLLSCQRPAEALQDATRVLELEPGNARALAVRAAADSSPPRRAGQSMQSPECALYGSGEVSSVPHASPAVRVGDAGPAGRGLFASRDVPAGAVLVCEPPFAAVVHKAARTSRCHACFQLLPLNQVPCKGCSFARYCSSSCMEAACAGVHKHECGSAWAAALPADAVLAVRVACGIQDARPNSRALDVAQLQAHWPTGPDRAQEKVEQCVLAAVLAQCLATRATSGTEASTASQLLRALRLVRTNCFAVTDDWAPQVYSGATRGEFTVATAVYATASLFNHSCCPQAHASFGVGGAIIVRATAPLLCAGMEIPIAYGPQQGQEPSHVRQAHLRTSHAFTCACAACHAVDVASRDAQLTGLKCLVGSECGGAVPFPATRKRGGDEEARCTLCQCIQPSDAIATAAAAAMHAKSTLGRARDTSDVAAARAAVRELLAHVHGKNRRVAEAWDVLAQTLHDRGEHEEALAACESSTAILSVHYPQGCLALGHEEAKLAGLAMAAGNAATSTAAAQRALACFRAHYGASYPRAAEMQTLMHSGALDP